MKTAIKFVVAACLLWPSPGDDAKKAKMPAERTDTIVGLYDVDGQQGDEQLEGICRVVKVGDAYVFQYLVGLGQSAAVGVRSGDHVATASRSGETMISGLFKVEKDGSLHGVWVAGGEFKKRTEVLTPRR